MLSNAEFDLDETETSDPNLIPFGKGSTSYWLRTAPEVDATNPNQVLVVCSKWRSTAWATVILPALGQTC